jgi:hypothetical protein
MNGLTRTPGYTGGGMRCLGGVTSPVTVTPTASPVPLSRLIIYGFTSRSRIFHLYGDVTITGEGLQNLGLCSALRAFEQGGIFIVTRNLGFSGLIWRTAPFSYLLRHTRGCGGSILTRILTGIHDHECGVIRCQGQCTKNGLTIGMQNDSMNVYNYELDHCNGQTLSSNETVENPVTSTCLSASMF